MSDMSGGLGPRLGRSAVAVERSGSCRDTRQVAPEALAEPGNFNEGGFGKSLLKHANPRDGSHFAVLPS